MDGQWAGPLWRREGPEQGKDLQGFLEVAVSVPPKAGGI